MADIHIHPRIDEMYSEKAQFLPYFIGTPSFDDMTLTIRTEGVQVYYNMTEAHLQTLKDVIDNYFLSKEVPLTPTISDLAKAEAEDNPPLGLLI